ncbi:hypothetical protein ACEWY4_027931 [Coilia grayii]|uniref:RNase H type-1 domain-containing protein n=1 Tax=Coilia grayii TaxID=363190 RepID=A0ABD1INT0_9TELE
MDFSAIAKPLQESATACAKLTDAVQWSADCEKAFVTLKGALASAPALGLSDYAKPFDLFVCEHKDTASAVLCQKHGGRNLPIAYVSRTLDTVASGLLPCLRAVAACADIVQMFPLTVYIPHEVHALLLQAKTTHLTSARLLNYQHILLAQEHITLTRCNTLNPATMLPSAVDGKPHDCLTVIEMSTKPRPDILDTPITNADCVFYVDGSSLRRDDGTLGTAYAVVSDHAVVETHCLSSNLSAQAAELVALSRACVLAAGKSLTVFTDSKYAHGIVHDFGAIWRERGFRTATGKPIQHLQFVSLLLDAIQLPSAVAVVKCEAHTNNSDSVSRGNAFAVFPQRGGGG